MNKKTIIDLPKQGLMTCQSALDQLLRTGAQQMLQQAIENEVTEYLQRYAG